MKNAEYLAEKVVNGLFGQRTYSLIDDVILSVKKDRQLPTIPLNQRAVAIGTAREVAAKKYPNYQKDLDNTLAWYEPAIKALRYFSEDGKTFLKKQIRGRMRKAYTAAHILRRESDWLNTMAAVRVPIQRWNQMSNEEKYLVTKKFKNSDPDALRSLKRLAQEKVIDMISRVAVPSSEEMMRKNRGKAFASIGTRMNEKKRERETAEAVIASVCAGRKAEKALLYA